MTFVITRKPGQQISIGDDIVITIVRISLTGEVRIGVDAPRHVRITRVEQSSEHRA